MYVVYKCTNTDQWHNSLAQACTLYAIVRRTRIQHDNSTLLLNTCRYVFSCFVVVVLLYVAIL